MTAFKLTGAACVLLGCVLPAIQSTAQERRHIHRLNALAEALDQMRRMLLLGTPPMEELLNAGASSEEETVKRFFGAVRLDELEDLPFSIQWKRALHSSGLQLNREEEQILKEIGQVLGQCGVEEQCQRLSQAVQRLRQLREQRRDALRTNQRLWYTLSASAGLVGIMVLF